MDPRSVTPIMLLSFLLALPVNSSYQLLLFTLLIPHIHVLIQLIPGIQVPKRSIHPISVSFLLWIEYSTL